MASLGNVSERIPMLDLSHEVRELWPELTDAIQRVLRSGHFVTGPEVKAFEVEAARYLGVAHAVGVNSGTDALVLGLRAAGVGPGDEVVTTPFTFFATVEAIVLAGATPVLVDIAPGTFLIDVDAVSQAVTERTKAIIPVHLFGEPVRMEPLLQLAEAHGVVVVEDCAQAFGASYAHAGAERDGSGPGAMLGSLGHVAAFSMYPTKNLGAYGDAGLIATDSQRIADAARSLRNHAADPQNRYVHRGIGYNSRLDELQAAILRVKLPHVDAWNRRRRALASRYDSMLAEVPGVVTPTATTGHVYHQYTIRVPADRRQRLRDRLSELGIATSHFYPAASTAWPEAVSPAPAHLPIAAKASDEVVSLPIHPWLADGQQDRVIDGVRSVLDR